MLKINLTSLVNGHIECRFNVSDGEWSKPELVLDPYLRIHGLSPALNYGQQAYEGMKGCLTFSWFLERE